MILEVIKIDVFFHMYQAKFWVIILKNKSIDSLWDRPNLSFCFFTRPKAHRLSESWDIFFDFSVAWKPRDGPKAQLLFSFIRRLRGGVKAQIFYLYFVIAKAQMTFDLSQSSASIFDIHSSLFIQCSEIVR